MLEFRKDLFADERDDDLNEIGKPTQRQDMLGHVTGRTKYFDDHAFDGLLHLKVLRSPHHHARIRRLDTSAAQSAPGVRRVMTGADVPVNLNTMLSLINFGEDDEPSLATDKVRYKGEPVAAVVAESEAAAYDALSKITVDYDPLPAVFDVEEALAPGAPQVNDVFPGNYFPYYDKYSHQKLRFGDVERAFAQADHVLEERYQMSPIEHAPVEPMGCIAAPETNNRIVVHTATQALFFSLGISAKILNIPSNRFHFIGGTVGGGFGGKVDTLTEPLAILGTLLTGSPVRFAFDRREEMQSGPPRGAERWYIKDGVMNDGRIVARQIRGYFDAGAYTRLTSYAVVKCTGHLPGPYTIPNVSSDVYAVYTNRTPATAMRGFGVTGVDFSLEVQMDKLAHLIGLDPMEFRILNAYRDGDMKAHRREAKNTALIECVQVAAEKAGWAIGDEYRRMSSLQGGGDRAMIPHTVTDENGKIGEPDQRPSSAPVPRPLPATPPQPAPAMAPAAPPPPPATPAPAPTPAPAAPAPARRAGGIRFSSISGTRRR
ncbi:MAG: xanthine dehydrogenase family protein molybdopterin-binding subunit [Alphaproteobacteria bacterium]|nr:xanthine dehydrogenase family protein molybdopterin-binding subunit [Alphaproteobacteria bacterium]